jgi:hypothetical protein
MAVEKFSISFDPELLAMVRDAADDDDETLSAWMAEAARRRIRHVALGHAVDALLADAGLTEEEALAAAAEARANAIHVRPKPAKAAARTASSTRRPVATKKPQAKSKSKSRSKSKSTSTAKAG